MRPSTFACAVAVLTFSLSAQTTNQWRYEKVEDQLHATTVDRLILPGTYLTPPTIPRPGFRPAIVVNCSAGKIRDSYFDIGALMKWRPDAVGIYVSGFEARLDGKKHEISASSASTDGQALYFLRVVLKWIINGKQLIIGADEVLGRQIVMQFELPEITPLMDKCGDDGILRGKR
jgi:hypothetical protein